MHAVILAAALNLWTALCPVATLLPQNQYGCTDPTMCCTDLYGCLDTCDTNEHTYCFASCNGLTGAAYKKCTDQCAVTHYDCTSWCFSNCPN